MTPSTAMALKNLMMVDRHSNQQKLGHIMMIQDISLITKLDKDLTILSEVKLSSCLHKKMLRHTSRQE